MKKIITLVTIIILILVSGISIYSKFVSDEIVTKIFGFGLLVITSGSMIPEIEVGEVILIKEKDSYEVGDIVTSNIDNCYLVTHRIVGIEDNKYVMKGDNNNCIDDKLIEKEEIEGKLIFHFKILGTIYNYRYLLIFGLIIVLILLSVV